MADRVLPVGASAAALSLVHSASLPATPGCASAQTCPAVRPPVTPHHTEPQKNLPSKPPRPTTTTTHPPHTHTHNPRPPPLLQLLSAVCYLHDRWVMHRDLKLSNLLFTHSGQLKLCDYGLARYFQPWAEAYTPGVVTLWYR